MVATDNNVLFYILSSLVLLVFTLTIKSLITRTTNSSTIKIRAPPSPPSLPVIGHLHLLGSGVGKSLKSMARKYGPLIQLQLGASTCIVVSDAQVARQVLKTHELNFSSRSQFGSSEYFLYKGCGFVSAQYGPYWRFMKKLCMAQLLSSSQVQRFEHIREQEIHKLLKSLMLCSSEGRASNLAYEFTCLNNNILCRMAMSTTCDSEEIHVIVKESVDLVGKLITGDVLGPLGRFDLFGYGKKLLKVVGRFDQVLERILKQHENKNNEASSGEESRDMMDIILQVYRDPNAEVRLTRNDIKAFFLDIFIGGTETSSTALQWIMAEMINHPRTLKRLKAEIDAVVGTSRVVNESDVPNLPYLQAVVKESQRLHPSVPVFPRQAEKDCIINGYNVKGQTRTLINVYGIMRDPQVWDSPEDFMPERFLEASNDGVKQQRLIRMSVDDFSYIPFGFGRRGCPGSSLALSVIHVTIAALIQCFDWKTQHGGKVDIQEGSSLSGAMAKPLVCYPIQCFSPF